MTFVYVILERSDVDGELVFYAIFQSCLVIYGGQFPQLEEHIVPLATDNSLSWDSKPSGEGREVSKRDVLTIVVVVYL